METFSIISAVLTLAGSVAFLIQSMRLRKMQLIARKLETFKDRVEAYHRMPECSLIRRTTDNYEDGTIVFTFTVFVDYEENTYPIPRLIKI